MVSCSIFQFWIFTFNFYLNWLFGYILIKFSLLHILRLLLLNFHSVTVFFNCFRFKQYITLKTQCLYENEPFPSSGGKITVYWRTSSNQCPRQGNFWNIFFYYSQAKNSSDEYSYGFFLALALLLCILSKREC